MKTALKLIVVVLIIVGCPPAAVSGPPDVTVSFEVTNPDFSIFAELIGQPGQNPASASAECAMVGVGSGYTYGMMSGSVNSETGWTNMSGIYYGSELDLASSTFAVDASQPNGSGASSTFSATHGIDATGVGPLEFSTTSDLLSGIYVYGNAAACSITDTWALGLGQTFEATAQSITANAGHDFEQRDSFGSLIGDPVNNQFTVDSEGSERFYGTAEGGSYNGSAFNLPDEPGFGFAASNFYLETQDDGTTTTTTNTLMYTDQIVGNTATWYDYPGYPNP